MPKIKRVNKTKARSIAANLSREEHKRWEGEKRTNGLFAKGTTAPPGAYRGRPHGAVARFPKILKEAALMAAAIHGSDGKGKDELVGYMLFLATDHPVCFAGILGRILPIQMNVSEGPLVIEAEKVREHLSHLSGDELAVLESVYNDPKLIDLTPEKEDA